MALNDLIPERITTDESEWERYTLFVRRRPRDNAWAIEVSGEAGTQGAFTMGDERKVRRFVERVLDRLGGQVGDHESR